MNHQTVLQRYQHIKCFCGKQLYIKHANTIRVIYQSHEDFDNCDGYFRLHYKENNEDIIYLGLKINDQVYGTIQEKNNFRSFIKPFNGFRDFFSGENEYLLDHTRKELVWNINSLPKTKEEFFSRAKIDLISLLI